MSGPSPPRSHPFLRLRTSMQLSCACGSGNRRKKTPILGVPTTLDARFRFMSSDVNKAPFLVAHPDTKLCTPATRIRLCEMWVLGDRFGIFCVLAIKFFCDCYSFDASNVNGAELRTTCKGTWHFSMPTTHSESHVHQFCATKWGEISWNVHWNLALLHAICLWGCYLANITCWLYVGTLFAIIMRRSLHV